MSKLKNITDEIMSFAEENDLLFSNGASILFSILVEDIEKKGIVRISNSTPIISYPKYNKKTILLYNDYYKSGFDKTTLVPSEYFIYIYDLNLLLMKEGASHRLAAIHRYVNDKNNNKLELESSFLSPRKINIEELKKYQINKKKQKIYYFDKNNKKIFIVDNLFISLIIFLQKKYLNKTNNLSYLGYLKFKYIYKESQDSFSLALMKLRNY